MNRTDSIKKNITQKLHLCFAKTLQNATEDQIYKAVALCVRDELMDTWAEGNTQTEKQGSKRLYYLSAEFLIGRALGNNMINLGLYEQYEKALGEMGLDIRLIEEQESDAALGNGGLGRLAACFLDSLSTLELPAMGCGIRYEYGLFKQRILDGEQVEVPDDWIDKGGLWQVQNAEDTVKVRFGGDVQEIWTDEGLKIHHKNYSTVNAVPYDMPIAGYQSRLCATLRLWSAQAESSLDLEHFNRGEYMRANEERELAEIISKVLYPENNHEQGKRLRLRQFYFLASATMQYMVKYHKAHFGDLHTLPDKACVQINDTHPTLAIPELMRILMDEEGFSWDEAFETASAVFNYTNHTVMPEALESWQADMFRTLLPRVYRIIETLNEKLLNDVRARFPGDSIAAEKAAILSHGEIRMANLCIAVCGKVNGVSKLHSQILKTKTFRDFYIMYPQKFLGITNGITPRRWLKKCNPRLYELLSSAIGDGFIKDLTQLSALREYASDSSFLSRLDNVKKENKTDFSNYLMRTQGIKTDPASIFDVQAKRLHEYKRQLLKVLHILHLYDCIKNGEDLPNAPITFIFAAKAAPGYQKAKNIIRLINAVSDLISSDERVSKQLQVVFLENYGVSAAEQLIPAADISEQLSTAGREASGTGNMKFMLNGALTVGTMDGANIEMFEQVGSPNIYIFGARADEIERMDQAKNYRPGEYFEKIAYIRTALNYLIDGSLQVNDVRKFSDIYHSLLFGGGERADRYYLLRDFESYDHTFRQMAKDYHLRTEWNNKVIYNIAGAGYFSSDRTIDEYNRHIWGLASPFGGEQ